MSYRLLSGTITGPKHIENDEKNQDSFYTMQENGFTVIATTDGAGSLKNSGTGAKIASGTAVNETMDMLLSGATIEESLRRGYHSARHSLTERDDAKELGCTLALVALSPRAWGSVIVGDAFVVYQDNTSSNILLQSESSGYANLTKLLTSKDPNPTYYIFDQSGMELPHDDSYDSRESILPKSICASSDGLLNTSVANNTATDGFWSPIFSRAQTQQLDVDALLQHMNDLGKIEDDTTLVIATIESEATINAA